MTKLGFTGTREGLSERQRQALVMLMDTFMRSHDKNEVHHGNCIGADKQMASIANARFCEVHSHPCDLPFMQADTQAHVTHDIKPPLDRNRDIVDICDILIAAPKSLTPSASGGTWYTIRYADRAGKPTIILAP